jgi:hypothetical protein
VRVVYAKGTFTSGPYMVRAGTHWPAEDPVVKAHPDAFSEDPRYGLFYSVEPPVNDDLTEEPRQKRAYVRRA